MRALFRESLCFLLRAPLDAFVRRPVWHSRSWSDPAKEEAAALAAPAVPRVPTSWEEPAARLDAKQERIIANR